MLGEGVRHIKVYVSVGSHGGIFEFLVGPVAKRYPHLLHVYAKQVTDDLIPMHLITESEWAILQEAKRLPSPSAAPAAAAESAAPSAPQSPQHE